MPLHYDAFANAVRKYDGRFVLENRQFVEFILGDLTNEDFLKQLFPKISDKRAAELAEEKALTFWELLQHSNCEPLPGAIELIHRLSDKGIDQFLVSTTSPQSVDHVLSSLGLSDYLVTREPIDGSKDPAFRSIISEKDPATVVAIDDLPSGIRTARHNKIQAIGVLAGMFWAGGDATSRAWSGLKKAGARRFHRLNDTSLRGLFD